MSQLKPAKDVAAEMASRIGIVAMSACGPHIYGFNVTDVDSEHQFSAEGEAEIRCLRDEVTQALIIGIRRGRAEGYAAGKADGAREAMRS